MLNKKFLIGLLLSTPIYANPISPDIFFLGFELCLFGEALVIALLLGNHGFHFFRTLLIWNIITMITYILFTLGLTFTMIFISKGTQPFSSNLFFYSIVILFELIVIYFESKIIKMFSKRLFFTENPKILTDKEAFKISVIGNMVSIYMGLIIVWKQSW